MCANKQNRDIMLYFLRIISFVILFGNSASHMYQQTVTQSPSHELWIGNSLPWVGVLLYKYSPDTKEAIAGIILINEYQAIGNAHGISKINRNTIRNTTKVMFVTSQVPTYFVVVDYLLHPEFEDTTFNTIAIIYLDKLDNKYKWNIQLDWPSKSSSLRTYQDIFAVGFTDRRGKLEQIAYKMENVSHDDCLNFYEKEQLDTKWMEPSMYRCYKAKYSSNQCVFDAGMALVTNSSGKWTLLGLSTLGPGCALPSRFIDFTSYVPWIERKTNATRRTETRSDQETHALSKAEYKKAWTEERLSPLDLDKYLMASVTDKTIVLVPVKKALDMNVESITHGNCSMLGDLVYRDEIKFFVTGYRQFGTGMYALSMYDFSVYSVACINVTLECRKRSKLKVWTTRGFQQESLDQFMRIVPMNYRGSKPRPQIVYRKDDWMNYEGIEIQHIHFRFEYYHWAKIHVQIHGSIYSDIARLLSTTTQPLTRTRRWHYTHIRSYKGRRRLMPDTEMSTAANPEADLAKAYPQTGRMWPANKTPQTKMLTTRYSNVSSTESPQVQVSPIGKIWPAVFNNTNIKMLTLNYSSIETSTKLHVHVKVRPLGEIRPEVKNKTGQGKISKPSRLRVAVSRTTLPKLRKHPDTKTKPPQNKTTQLLISTPGDSRVAMTTTVLPKDRKHPSETKSAHKNLTRIKTSTPSYFRQTVTKTTLPKLGQKRPVGNILHTAHGIITKSANKNLTRIKTSTPSYFRQTVTRTTLPKVGQKRPIGNMLHTVHNKTTPRIIPLGHSRESKKIGQKRPVGKTTSALQNNIGKTKILRTNNSILGVSNIPDRKDVLF